MTGTLYVCETTDDYDRHAKLGRRAVLQSDFKNGSLIEASRIVLTGGDTGKLRGYIAKRYDDGSKLLLPSKKSLGPALPCTRCRPQAAGPSHSERAFAVSPDRPIVAGRALEPHEHRAAASCRP